MQTKERYEKRHELIEALPQDKLTRPPKAFERIVKRAAEWIDENPPPHITEADGLQHGMTPWRATVLCVRIELRAWIQVDE
jgi:hypothetical protein